MYCKTEKMTVRRTVAPVPYARRGVAVRLIYLLVSLLYGAWSHQRSRGDQTVVLCYHGIRKDQASRFRRQMVWLFGYLRRSKATAPVLVTFDDSFANLADYAVPVLEELRIPCIIFAVADNLGRVPEWSLPAGHPDREETVMDANQLSLLAQSPLITIGSHTGSHPNLTMLTETEIERELAGSRERLERITGDPVDNLALPHGAFDTTVLRLAQKAGYRRIFTLEEKPADLQRGGTMGRFLMSPDVWMMEFILTCKGGYLWLYSLRKFIRSIKRFVT